MLFRLGQVAASARTRALPHKQAKHATASAPGQAPLHRPGLGRFPQQPAHELPGPGLGQRRGDMHAVQPGDAADGVLHGRLRHARRVARRALDSTVLIRCAATLITSSARPSTQIWPSRSRIASSDVA